MHSTGIKARTFALLVGCHYTTIYDLLKKDDLVPLPVMQENIYNVLDFLEHAVANSTLPLNGIASTAEKNTETKRLYESYKRG